MVQPDNTNPRRFDRDSWLVLAAIAAMLALTLTLTLISYRLPNDGWVYDEFIDERGATADFYLGESDTPLQAGDVILSADGIPQGGNENSQFLLQYEAGTHWREGGAATYEVIRSDETLTLAVPLEPQPLSRYPRYLARTIVSDVSDLSVLITTLLIVVLFLLRPRDLGARALLASVLTYPLFDLILYSYNAVAAIFWPPVIFQIGFVLLPAWAWWMLPSLLTFILVFPRRRGPMRHHARRTIMLLYGIPLLVTILSITIFSTPAIAIAMLGIEVVIFTLLAFGLTIHTIRRDPDPLIRAQMGWVVLGLVLWLVPSLIWFQFTFWAPQALQSPMWGLIEIPTAILSSAALPVCMGIAILRFRVFDIAVIIRRTLIYSTLTAILAGVYFGGVTLLQSLFANLTSSNSTLAVVISTLVIAALFTPVRRRVQAFVDRRFYRQKYDTQKTLDAFAASMRDEVDLDRIHDDLLDVVNDTLQPQSIGLWLAPDATTRRDTP